MLFESGGNASDLPRSKRIAADMYPRAVDWILKHAG